MADRAVQRQLADQGALRVQVGRQLAAQGEERGGDGQIVGGAFPCAGRRGPASPGRSGRGLTVSWPRGDRSPELTMAGPMARSR